MQSRVREEFKKVEKEVTDRDGRSGVWMEVSAEGGIEEVKGRVWEVVKGEGWLEKGLGEVKRLWV